MEHHRNTDDACRSDYSKTEIRLKTTWAVTFYQVTFICALSTLGSLAHAEGIFSRLFGGSIPPEILEGKIDVFEEDIFDLEKNITQTLNKLKNVNEYDIEDAEEEAEFAREEVEEVLKTVKNGGDLDVAARNNIKWMRKQKIRVLQRDNLSERNKKIFIEAWETHIIEAEKLFLKLQKVEAKLGEKLRAIQNAEGVLEELILLGRAGESNKIVREIIGDLNSFIQYIDTINIDYKAPSLAS